MIKVKKDYLEAKVRYKMVLNLKRQCQEKILSENEFYTTEGEKVNLLNDFLMVKDDFTKYLKLCFEEYKNVGLNPKHYNKVIDYPYMTQLRKAEDNLIKWGKSKIQKLAAYKLNVEDIERLYKEINHNFKIREKVIKLTMSCKEEIK